MSFREERYESETQPPLTLSDVFDESGSADAFMLKKPHDFNDYVDNMGLPGDLAQNLKNLPKGRQEYHMLRLLEKERSDVEKLFAADFINRYEEVRSILRERLTDDVFHDISFLVNGECPSTTMWWTVAPYLYNELLKYGLSSTESLVHVFEWAKGANAFEKDEITLPGLEELNSERIKNAFALSRNSRDMSHKYAKQLAKKVFDLLLPSFA
ncbi:MAG: hypothetical protein WCW14_04235 [Candidatus Paceibacterota bacterium]|jgi:hypothetical protein